jgi:hypothetical protein
VQVNRLFKENILKENRLLVLESIVLRQMFGPDDVSRVWWSEVRYAGVDRAAGY